jgi:mRNA-degrading endonuclease RelE of RelBE toxin-antitoxin system
MSSVSTDVPRLRLTRDADGELDALPNRIRDAVLSTILRLQANPWSGGKPLRGHLRPLWSARVGSYRILYTIEGSEQSATVVVRGIRHRTVAYRRRRAAEGE